QTPTEADDIIIGRLEAIDGKIARAEAEIANLRREAIDLSRRRSEIEKVRERFRGMGYDHPQSTFGNDGDIADMLKGMLEGAVRSGVLWDMLRQGHQSRPARGSTDFGLPDFPMPFPTPREGDSATRGGGWRNPSSRGGWLPAPPDRPSDKDDFTTGGSF